MVSNLLLERFQQRALYSPALWSFGRYLPWGGKEDIRPSLNSASLASGISSADLRKQNQDWPFSGKKNLSPKDQKLPQVS